MRRRWYVTWALVGIAAILVALAWMSPASPLLDDAASVSSVLEAPAADEVDDVALVAMAVPTPVPARRLAFSPVAEAVSAPALPPPVPPPEP
jgi:hypothetical protein